MKKQLAIFCAFLLLIAIIPQNAVAYENIDLSRDELIDLACDVFPEYAEIIQGKNALNTNLNRSSQSNELVVYETRSISDQNTIFYMQYSDGVAYAGNLYCYPEVAVTNTSTGGGATACTCTITMTCNYSYEVFRAQNVKFTIVGQGNDMITDMGNISSSTTNRARYGTLKRTEDTGPAYAQYHIQFSIDKVDGYTPAEVTLYFYVQSNSYWAEYR